MAKTRPSKEYTAFDKAMGKILSVPRADIERKMREHRTEKRPRPGPRRKAVTPSADDRDGGEPSSS
jgi:hypothetical protein